MKKWLACINLLILCINYCIAQTASGSVSGKISDKQGKQLSSVNVVLLHAKDSTLAKADLTNDNGVFDIESIKDGQYLLKATLLGFTTYSSQTININGNAVKLADIVMNESNTSLKEVTVAAAKPFIEVHADKIVVNVENSIVSAGSSVMDVLSRSPGVTVDNNDNISLKGKQGVNIMIDGKIQPISGEDLANLLKSMPSGSVDKIEIISNPSAKYDAAGTAGIINIKTKKDNRIGLNGSVNASYGQGVYPKTNEGFNVNYRNKKFNVYVNYNYSFREGMSRVTFDRKFYANGISDGAYDQNNYSILQFQTNLVSTGVDYNVSSKTTIGISLTGETFYLGTKGYYFSNVLDESYQPQSYFVTDNTSSGNWYNYAANIHLKHSFDSTGKELTVDGDYARYWNKNHQDFTTDYYLLDGTMQQAPFLLHGDITGLTQIRSFKADYENPLKNDASFEAGIKTSFVTADNMPLFYDRSTGVNIFDPGVSDHFIYNENINAAYVNANKNWKKWSTQLGLRAEQTIVHGDEKITNQTFEKDYTQLFPSLAVQNHINPQNDLGLTLSRRIERPGYEDLNPYIFFVDPSTYKEGNPYLNPALTYSVELSHVYKQRLITTFTYSVTDNVITQVIEPSPTQDKVTIQTNQNLAHMFYYGVSGAYTIPIFKWWSNVTNFDAYYARYQGNLANTMLNNGKPTFDINTVNSFVMPKNWSAELSAFYLAPQVYGYFNLNQLSMISAGVQKNMFNKRVTIKLNATDIFWHGNSSGTSIFTNYYEVFNARHDTRQVTLAIVYRFGKRTVSPVRKHSGGAEEEEKRAQSSNT